MEIQTSADTAEILLRDDLENIYMLLFPFVANGFKLALCNVGWLTTQKFVILVPDPIVLAPWSVLYGCTASFVTTRSRHIFPTSAFCDTTRMTWAMASPRINCNTTTVTVLAASAATTLSLRVCVLLVSTLITWRPRRVPSTMSTSPSSSAWGQPCVICQDTSHKATLSGRAAEDRRE